MCVCDMQDENLGQDRNFRNSDNTFASQCFSMCQWLALNIILRRYKVLCASKNFDD